MLDEHRPTIVLSANSCWNLLNFRDALITGLQDAGYRIAAFAPADGHADGLRRRGIELHAIPMARSAINPLADARLFLRYAGALRRIRPAAYCGFTIKPNIYGAAAARIAGIPTINNVTGLGTTFLSRGLMWSLTARMYRWALRRSYRVLFHNQEDLGIFVRERIIGADQGAVIPGSGIDLDRFKPVPAKSDGVIRFLFVGRAMRDKGIGEFVEAAHCCAGACRTSVSRSSATPTRGTQRP